MSGRSYLLPVGPFSPLQLVTPLKGDYDFSYHLRGQQTLSACRIKPKSFLWLEEALLDLSVAFFPNLKGTLLQTVEPLGFLKGTLVDFLASLCPAVSSD